MPRAYRGLLGVPHARPLMLAALVGRLPIGVTSLALVLFVRESTGSFGVAGAVTACFAAAGGFIAPIQGRLVDRIGQPAVLVPSALINTAAVGGLVAAGLTHAPLVYVYVCAAFAGAFIPPLSACMRSLWSTILAEDPLLEAAYAVESVSVELFFIAGPLLTAALVALASPAAALVTSGALSLLGTLAFVASPVSRGWRGAPSSGDRAGALASKGMRTLLITVVPSAVVFGTLEVSLPAFADRNGSIATGGVLLAAFAAGSMVGGLWAGSRRWTMALERRYVRLTALFAAGLALPPLAGSDAVMALLVFVSGLTLAPIVTVAYGLLDRLAPEGTQTEAYTWIITANVAGSAIGSALAGVLVQHVGVHWALLAACSGATAGALLAFLRRGTLVAPRGPVDAWPAEAEPVAAPAQAHAAPTVAESSGAGSRR